MALCGVELIHFRGIDHLKLALQDISVLVGENQWGRSTLFDALSLFLSHELPQSSTLYQLKPQDFYKNETSVTLLFKFSLLTSQLISLELPILQQQLPILQNNATNCTFYYRVQGSKQRGLVVTHHQLLNEQQQPVALGTTELIKWLNYFKQRMPILGLGRSRATAPQCTRLAATFKMDDQVYAKANILWEQLAQHEHCFPQKKFKQSIQAIHALLTRYLFAEQCSSELLLVSNGIDQGYWSALSEFTLLLSQLKKQEPLKSSVWQQGLLALFLLLLYPSSRQQDLPQQPILLIQNIENHFHPIMLAIVWSVLDNLPLQKIVVTNSGVLLSLIPLEAVCRIVREPQQINSYQLAIGSLNHSEKRRLAFHIQLNRAATLFARYWLLVEGETEIWLLSELSKQAGYLFENEGIKIIEFAQCGLKPLLKLAHGLGIGWHVMTDSDDAGQKYAQTVAGFCQSRHYDVAQQLTVLTALDIEHFMFNQGFAEVYYTMAHLDPQTTQYSKHKVIQHAIRQSSKPDLAIEVAEVSEQRGRQAIPPLLRNMFNLIIQRARETLRIR